MHPKTARLCLKRLAALNIIRSTPRPGQSWLREIKPVEQWNPSPFNTEVTPPKQIQGRPPKLIQGTPPKVSQPHPSPNNPDKVSPIKLLPEISPLKGKAAPPIFLNEAIAGNKLIGEQIENRRSDLEYERDPEKRKSITAEIQRLKKRKREFLDVIEGRETP